MNLRTHISRSNGYRELGMFDEKEIFGGELCFLQYLK